MNFGRISFHYCNWDDTGYRIWFHIFSAVYPFDHYFIMEMILNTVSSDHINLLKNLVRQVVQRQTHDRKSCWGYQSKHWRIVKTGEHWRLEQQIHDKKLEVVIVKGAAAVTLPWSCFLSIMKQSHLQFPSWPWESIRYSSSQFILLWGTDS